MVLPIVVNTDRKIAIDKSEYNHGMENGLPDFNKMIAIE